jgi:murein DD-endopeptidase MepM/ murein hydrolase activator NlpD
MPMPKLPRGRVALPGLVLAALTALGVARSGHADEPVPTSTLAPAAPSSSPAAAPASTMTTDEASLETPRPTRWRPRVMRCRRYRRSRYCEGPRRMPIPSGSAAERAERLGLASRRAAARVKDRTPPAEWVAEVEGEAHESLVFPVDEGRQGRGLARRRGRRPGHDGVDIMAPVGTRVRSVDDGLVVYSDNELRGYGNTLLVLHADGTVALYAHLRAGYVFAGQSVRRGQVIGEVGETGLTRGAHLHFELRRGGRPVNPIPRFVRPAVPTASIGPSQGVFTRRA